MEYQPIRLNDFTVKLRSLKFEPQPPSGDEVTFHAELSYPEALGAPVFALDVTTSLSGASTTGDPEQQKPDSKWLKQVQNFLEQLQAGFLLMTPGSAEEPSEAPDPDPDPGLAEMEISIVPSLVSINVRGDLDIVFVVASAISAEPPASDSPHHPVTVWAVSNTNLPAGGCQSYHARNRPISGTVYCTGGWIRVNGLPKIHNNQHDDVTTKKVRVRAVTSAAYYITGSYH